LDYFWCIKYQHEYLFIYENGKKREKKKGKQFLVKWAGEIFGPTERAGEPAQAAHERGNGAGGCGDDVVGAGPSSSEGGGETTLGGREWGSTREGELVAGARQWFSAGGPVLGDRGGGLARAGVGGHGGGVNLAGGGLGLADLR
jgi:hypothetical protein